MTDLAWLGSGEDIRRRERQCIAYRRLLARVQAVQGVCLVQCREELASLARDWTSAEGMSAFVVREREERRCFAYPPSTRVVKIIIRGDQTQAQAWRLQAESHLSKSTLHYTWRGPFSVEHLPSSRHPRVILHLILPPQTPEPTLIACLQPLVSEGVLIDLDPIAFLR